MDTGKSKRSGLASINGACVKVGDRFESDNPLNITPAHPVNPSESRFFESQKSPAGYAIGNFGHQIPPSLIQQQNFRNLCMGNPLDSLRAFPEAAA
jgi:hypothetical protein